MQLVLDYGGVIVEHDDERDHADVLGVDPKATPTRAGSPTSRSVMGSSRLPMGISTS